MKILSKSDTIKLKRNFAKYIFKNTVYGSLINIFILFIKYMAYCQQVRVNNYGSRIIIILHCGIMLNYSSFLNVF